MSASVNKYDYKTRYGGGKNQLWPPDVCICSNQSVKSAKLHSYWQGPYKVVKVFSNVLYLIQHRDSTHKKVVVHFDRLKTTWSRIKCPEHHQSWVEGARLFL